MPIISSSQEWHGMSSDAATKVVWSSKVKLQACQQGLKPGWPQMVCRPDWYELQDITTTHSSTLHNSLRDYGRTWCLALYLRLQLALIRISHTILFVNLNMTHHAMYAAVTTMPVVCCCRTDCCSTIDTYFGISAKPCLLPTRTSSQKFPGSWWCSNS